MNINEMSDSREVYDSKPSSIFAIFIYTILGIITVALIWTYFGRIDIVIKSKDKGTFHLSCLPVPLSSPQCLPCVNNPVPTSPDEVLLFVVLGSISSMFLFTKQKNSSY